MSNKYSTIYHESISVNRDFCSLTFQRPINTLAIDDAYIVCIPIISGEIVVEVKEY